MPQDLKAFEGEWCYLEEEEPLAFAAHQLRTIADGKVISNGAEVGTCAIDDDRFELRSPGPPRYEIVFHATPEALAAGYLSGNTTCPAVDEDDTEWSTYCVLIRMTETTAVQAGSTSLVSA